MMATTDTTEIVANPGEPFLTITREFDAPRELVFEAFTRPEHVVRWFGPRRLTNRVDKLDLRPGGEWRYVSRDLDGTEYGFRGHFKEIVPPERLVWTFEFEGVPGQVSVEELTLVERDGKTTVTSVARYASVEARDAMVASGMEGGLRESYQRMDELLADMAATADRQIVQRRVFDAPRDRVWEMWTRPEHVDRWFGPRGFTTTTHEMDFRPGGVWRFDMTMADGPTYPNRVAYLEIEPTTHLVYEHGDADGGNAFHVTVAFVDQGGKTELTMRQLLATAAARDYAVREVNAIELGRETLDKLAETLAAA